MDLRSYFDAARGHGILATADAAGRVNMAIFSRPHVLNGSPKIAGKAG